jgi:spore germination protein KB
MVGNHKVSWQQCTLLITLFTIGTSILVIPSSLAAIAKQDAWVVPIVATGIGWLIIRLFIKIGDTFPTMNLVEINELVFGKWIAMVVNILFVFFSLHTSAQVLYYVGNFLTTEIMAETPIEVINILFMVIIVMGVRLGLETLARTAEIFIPWVFLLYAIFLFSVSPQSQLKRMEPILEAGLHPIIHATLIYLSYSCLPLVVMLVFFPKELNARKDIQKSFSVGFIGGSILMIILTFVTILVLGPEFTARQAYSVYVLAKGINIANFLQRIEAIIAGIWFITIYFKLAFYFFSSVLSLSQTLKLKDYSPLVYPMGIMVVVLSFNVYPNTAYMGKWDTETWVPYIFSIGLLYPTLLLVISKCKKYFYSKRQINK